MKTRPDPAPLDEPPRWRVWAAGGALILAVAMAYSNSLSGPFVFDDVAALPDNPALRHLSTVLSPPASSSLAGRPLLALTFGLNYALGQYQVWGYHVVNAIIHGLAALALFGVLRNAFRLPSLRMRIGRDADRLAFAGALIWALHPLNTQAVTYVVQRAESLMGLFYLLTIYCFQRGLDARRPRLWLGASVMACLAGMCTKEVMASAPLIVFLYDRVFVTGSYLETWRSRKGYYMALAATGIVLVWLVASLGGNRGGGTGGFSSHARWGAYWLTQFPAVLTYLRLSLVPHPLIFEYGTQWAKNFGQVAIPAVVVAALALGTLWAWFRSPATGFLGVSFFAILAPTSIVPGTTQMIVEHRMYLALIPVIVLLLLAAHRWFGRTSILAAGVVALVFGGLTYARNNVYRSEVALWKDTLARRPANTKALLCLGNALVQIPGRMGEAIATYRSALAISPDLAEVHNNLGNALVSDPADQVRPGEAIDEFRAAIRTKPDFIDAYVNLGAALAEIPGKLPEAVATYEQGLKLDPHSAKLHYDLAVALVRIPGKMDEACSEFQAAGAAQPDFFDAHLNAGMAFLRLPGHDLDARAEFETALRINPDSVEAHLALGSILAASSADLAGAIRHFEAAQRLRPNDESIRRRLESIRELGGASTANPQ
ncbi:MAG: tetratricopeptide repeat protein [Opitutaceae bacterium]